MSITDMVKQFNRLIDTGTVSCVDNLARLPQLSAKSGASY